MSQYLQQYQGGGIGRYVVDYFLPKRHGRGAVFSFLEWVGMHVSYCISGGGFLTNVGLFYFIIGYDTVSFFVFGGWMGLTCPEQLLLLLRP